MFVSVNGVRLHVDARGEGPPILLLHGFTGSARTWEPFHAAWGGRRIIAPDLLGHGRSDCPADPQRYSLTATAADLRALLDALGVERCTVLGYSMGGRVALRFAVEAPARVAGLILESTSPGIGAPQDREARVRADGALAARIERQGVPAFVDHWQALPLFRTQAALPQRVRDRLRAERLSQRAEGLANSLRGAGAGGQEPLP